MQQLIVLCLIGGCLLLLGRHLYKTLRQLGKGGCAGNCSGCRTPEALPRRCPTEPSNH